MRTILIRTLSGALYIAIILGSLLLSKPAFAVVLCTLNIIALTEFLQFKTLTKNSLPVVTVSLLSFLLAHLTTIRLIDAKWLNLLFIVFIAFCCYILFSKEKEPIIRISYSIMGIVYITLPCILLNRINLVSEDGFSVIILLMFVIIWTNDTFAYLTGLAIGKHKLYERISPKKTWEGFVGGIFFALIAGFILFRFIDNLSLFAWLLLVTTIAVSSVLGDLAESLFKRDANVKDSGKIMPGHGGILDRIDSLLFVAPIVYIYLLLI